MLVDVKYVKNCSTDRKHYEIKSKIIKTKYYKGSFEDGMCEIQGEYFAKVKANIPYYSTFESYYQKLVFKRIKNKINKFLNNSKRLVREWELRNNVLNDTEKFIETLH